MNINKYLARQFSNPSGLGGRIVTRVMNRQNYHLYEETERLLRLNDSEWVLDIGCGNGFVLEMLAKHNECKYVGIDISQSILKAAKKRNKMHIRRGMMSFECRTVNDTSFESASFDKVYTINTCYFWDDLDVAMKEIKRILKPGGVFVNTLYTSDTLDSLDHTQFDYKHYSQKQLIASAQSIGFEVEVIEILGGKAYCMVCCVVNKQIET